MSTVVRRNTPKCNNTLTLENNKMEYIDLLDEWNIGVYSHDGKLLYNKEYVAPLIETFFNVRTLRDGMTLLVTWSNYSNMPVVMKTVFTFINGHIQIPERLLEQNKTNFKKRLNPTFILDLNVIQIKFWLIKRTINKKTV